MNTKAFFSKPYYYVFFYLLMSTLIYAQAPQKLSYQAIIRNADNSLVTNSQIGIQVSILQGSENGSMVYSETFSPTTNSNGLVSIEIGNNANLNTIDWSMGPYFLKTETDPTGGNNYTITGVSELLSVPYAFHSNTATNFSPGNSPGEMKYWNGVEWTSIEPGNEGDVLTFVNNTPTWMGDDVIVDNVPNVINPVTGKTWMDRNLGASQVATSMTDEAAYGDVYQWGRATDGHEKRTSSITSTLSTTDNPGHDEFIINPDSPFDWRVPQNHNLWDGEDGINNPCPQGYRLPTESEWNLERMSWSSNDAEGAFNSVLKLPAAGQRKFSDGTFIGTGVSGGYWSSTLSNEGGGIYSRFLNFRYSAYVISSHRATAYSIRCIKD